MFPFSLGANLGGFSLLKNGKNVRLKLWVKLGCSRRYTQWCPNGIWLANWLELIFSTHARGATCKKVSVFAVVRSTKLGSIPRPAPPSDARSTLHPPGVGGYEWGNGR